MSSQELAINGGDPVRDNLLPYGSQWIDDEDIEAVSNILVKDWITQGPRVEEFERRVADYCGADFAVAMSNGTSALHAACSVAGVLEEDEVITTPLTFAADANVVVHNNGKPIFSDIDSGTLNIDPERIQEKITDKTKAIIPVDFAGLPCKLEKINEIAKENDLTIIEDAAHALGAEYKGKKVGSLSDMTVFSFHPVKHITTGEGGMILTDSEEYYEKLKRIRHHGIVRKEEDLNRKEGPWYYEIHKPGYNYRITDFQCALGISQMDKLGEFLEKRRTIADRYRSAFQKIEEIKLQEDPEDRRSAYHIFVIQLKTEELKFGRKKIFEALRSENIGVNVHYVPIHLQPFYRKEYEHERGDFPKTENYYDRAITLPLFPKMTEKDVVDSINAVKKVIEYYQK